MRRITTVVLVTRNGNSCSVLTGGTCICRFFRHRRHEGIHHNSRVRSSTLLNHVIDSSLSAELPGVVSKVLSFSKRYTLATGVSADKCIHELLVSVRRSGVHFSFRRRVRPKQRQLTAHRSPVTRGFRIFRRIHTQHGRQSSSKTNALCRVPVKRGTRNNGIKIHTLLNPRNKNPFIVAESRFSHGLQAMLAILSSRLWIRDLWLLDLGSSYNVLFARFCPNENRLSATNVRVFMR